MLALPDEELVARCKKELPGNTNSYEELVRRHKNRVYSVAPYMRGKPTEPVIAALGPDPAFAELMYRLSNAFRTHPANSHALLREPMDSEAFNSP